MLTIQKQVNLTRLNTMRLSATASHYVRLNHIDQLAPIADAISNFSKFFVLGGGSNIILPTTYHGLVIHNQLRGINMTNIGDDRLVTAMAGENWDEFVAYCTMQGAFGLENLSLIPGCVGGAPIQNIGAYGVEVKDFIEEVLVYNIRTAEFVTLTNKACGFSYRDSLLKNNSDYIVISVTFRLSAKTSLNLSYADLAKRMSSIASPTPADLRQLVIDIRQSKLPDPKELGNAGSFFHNPVMPKRKLQHLLTQFPNLPQFPTSDPEQIKISAGWLIDNLGLKGFRHGNIGIYPKQALVLVNYGKAYQSELLAFAKGIQSKVNYHYELDLQIEPIIVKQA